MTKKRIVHYINQFYAGIGGEEMAGEVKPEARQGVVGPGAALQAALGDAAEVVGTVICGDGYYAEHMDEANEEILKLIAGFQPVAAHSGGQNAVWFKPVFPRRPGRRGSWRRGGWGLLQS